MVDAIVNAISSVSNVYLLGREMDADHNRAVITIVGSPECPHAATRAEPDLSGCASAAGRVLGVALRRVPRPDGRWHE